MEDHSPASPKENYQLLILFMRKGSFSFSLLLMTGHLRFYGGKNCGDVRKMV